jgi:uncharacterized protein (DUF433 family)
MREETSPPTVRLASCADSLSSFREDRIRIADRYGRRSCPVYTFRVDEKTLLKRITVNPAIFAGKPIIRGRRLAVEHVLGMLAAGDTPETILEGYPWLEPEDIQACLAYAHRLVAHERIEPLVTTDAE